uniref:MYND-type domain-containing protein n=1 Tax=Lotharella oceanica TaxID=641309 RepID=A0A7S2TMJ4_9EUKA|mmetsp:Transcript_21146/g.39683  ORF Transcript_21146/g.39683 Transcript_21146/m.39683 type:complete len:226 (+) Transcript_21146:103-780(+)
MDSSQCHRSTRNEEEEEGEETKGSLAPCAWCYQRGPQYLCGGCHMVSYCSLECQGRDWEEHMHDCPLLAECQIDRVFPSKCVEVKHSKKRRNVRSCLRTSKSPPSEKKKKLTWEKGLITETEAQIAQICSMLRKGETVKVAILRYRLKAMRGDKKAIQAWRQIRKIAKRLLDKGIDHIYRTSKEMLLHLAADADHLSEASISLSESFVSFDSLPTTCSTRTTKTL